MISVSDTSCRENQHILCLTTFPPPLPKAVPCYSTVWKYSSPTSHRQQYDLPHALCMLIDATDTHSWYAILIASLLQQRLRERTSMLRYMYTACLVRFLHEIRVWIHSLNLLSLILPHSVSCAHTTGRFSQQRLPISICQNNDILRFAAYILQDSNKTCHGQQSRIFHRRVLIPGTKTVLINFC
jgi:hypothetical protein